MIETRYFDVADRAPGADGPGKRPARLAVHLAGKGPLAVLIHGFPLDHRMWLDVLQGPLAGRRRLCAIDLRGHGRSPWRGDAVHTMQLFADDIAAVVKATTDEPADVAGLSMGGYVAFALHQHHPDLVRSLVLSNTRAAADTQAQQDGRNTAIDLVVDEGRAALADGMLPKLLAQYADPIAKARIRTMIEDLPVESIVADQRGLQQRPDRLDELAGISVPTLVVAGDQDVITPVAEAEVMASKIPDARLEVVRGTGHMTPLEQPDRWSAAVASLWS